MTVKKIEKNVLFGEGEGKDLTGGRFNFLKILSA